MPIWTMRSVAAHALDGAVALGNRVRHGLFAVDVLAGLHGVEHHRHVPVVRGRDEDGVDIGAVEDAAVVGVRLRAGGRDFEPLLKVGLVDVGNGGALRPELDEGFGHAASTAAGADQRHRDAFVGALGGRRQEQRRGGGRTEGVSAGHGARIVARPAP